MSKLHNKPNLKTSKPRTPIYPSDMVLILARLEKLEAERFNSSGMPTLASAPADAIQSSTPTIATILGYISDDIDALARLNTRVDFVASVLSGKSVDTLPKQGATGSAAPPADYSLIDKLFTLHHRLLGVRDHLSENLSYAGAVLASSPPNDGANSRLA